MPKPGYANFTIREEAHRHFEKYMQEHRLSMLDFGDLLSQALVMNIEPDLLLNAIKQAPLLKLKEEGKHEAIKISLANIYYCLDAACNTTAKLMPKFTPLSELQNIAGSIQRLLDNTYPKWFIDIKPIWPRDYQTEKTEPRDILWSRYKAHKYVLDLLEEAKYYTQKLKPHIPDLASTSETILTVWIKSFGDFLKEEEGTVKKIQRKYPQYKHLRKP